MFSSSETREIPLRLMKFICFFFFEMQARPLLSRALEEDNYDGLIDPRLETNYDPYDMARLVACAAAAVRQTARHRPRMSQVLH